MQHIPQAGKTRLGGGEHTKPEKCGLVVVYRKPGKCGLGAVYRKPEKRGLVRITPSRISPAWWRSTASRKNAAWWCIKPGSVVHKNIPSRENAAWCGLHQAAFLRLGERIHPAGKIRLAVHCILPPNRIFPAWCVSSPSCPACGIPHTATEQKCGLVRIWHHFIHKSRFQDKDLRQKQLHLHLFLMEQLWIG